MSHAVVHPAVDNQFLNTQIDSFIDALENYNKKRQDPNPPKNYNFLRDFYKRFFEDRNKRSSDIESSSYEEVVKLANEQFAATTLWDLCMDGRVLAILVNGASAGVGSSIRVPGGILREFVRGTDGKFKLKEGSVFANLLEGVAAKCPTKTFFEVYDSHIGCAARKAEELAHGHDASDSGLFADVVHKKEMATATAEFIKVTFGNAKRVVTIQTSFDPHTGYIMMGLDNGKALDYAEKNGGVYSQSILEKLTQDGVILSAEHIANTEKVTSVFEKYLFDLDWKNHYVESAAHFWKNISSMKNELLPYIEELVVDVSPHLKESGEEEKEEKKERAMLLLTSAYSGFLNNQRHVDTEQVSDQFDEHHNYPYGVHREEGVKVSEGGYPPYQISMFVVFSLDKKNLPANIELASSLVRSNRREGRVVDRAGIFTDPMEFSEGPVPVVVQELVREKISGTEWDFLQKIDWSDLPHNWDTMSTSDFYSYLQSKGGMNIAIANGLNRLRERMAILYDPDNPTSAHLIEHYKVALPVVVGKNRRNYFIVPFFKLGFE